jgi:hypothetical protein
MNPDEALRRLKDRMATVADLDAAAEVLSSDQQTYKPDGGVAGRAEQLAPLNRLSHERLASGATARLLDASGEQEPGSVAAAIVRRASREHERATGRPRGRAVPALPAGEVRRVIRAEVAPAILSIPGHSPGQKYGAREPLSQAPGTKIPGAGCGQKVSAPRGIGEARGLRRA